MKAELRLYGRLISFLFALLLPFSVKAVSPEELQKKLESIIVFVVVDGKGGFYQNSVGKIDQIPLFLRFADAQARLDYVMSSADKSKVPAEIRFYRLGTLYDQLEPLRDDAAKRGRSLLSKIYSPKKDMEAARKILKKSGFSDEQLKKGLSTPVFYSEPMITSKTSSGSRQLFFLEYQQLSDATTRLDRKGLAGDLQLKVADLQVVLDLISDSDEDVYSFVATKDAERVIDLLKSSEATR